MGRLCYQGLVINSLGAQWNHQESHHQQQSVCESRSIPGSTHMHCSQLCHFPMAFIGVLLCKPCTDSSRLYFSHFAVRFRVRVCSVSTLWLNPLHRMMLKPKITQGTRLSLVSTHSWENMWSPEMSISSTCWGLGRLKHLEVPEKVISASWPQGWGGLIRNSVGYNTKYQVKSDLLTKTHENLNCVSPWPTVIATT